MLLLLHFVLCLRSAVLQTFYLSSSSFCWSCRRWSSKTRSCSRGGKVLVFISDHLVSPVASECFVGDLLGLRVLAFSGLRLRQWPPKGSASNPCTHWKHFRMTRTGNCVALLGWMMSWRFLAEWYSWRATSNSMFRRSHRNYQYGDHQSPCKMRLLAWLWKVGLCTFCETVQDRQGLTVSFSFKVSNRHYSCPILVALGVRIFLFLHPFSTKGRPIATCHSVFLLRFCWLSLASV